MGVEDIVVVEPRTEHLYKPLFSHVAGGTAPGSMAVREQGSVMPKGVAWVQDAVTAIDPEEDSVLLESGGRLTYDHLIVSAGIQHDWDAVPGLAEAMQTLECVVALRVRPRPEVIGALACAAPRHRDLRSALGSGILRRSGPEADVPRVRLLAEDRGAGRHPRDHARSR